MTKITQNGETEKRAHNSKIVRLLSMVKIRHTLDINVRFVTQTQLPFWVEDGYILHTGCHGVRWQ